MILEQTELALILIYVMILALVDLPIYRLGKQGF